MIVLISPAKSLDFEKPSPIQKPSMAAFPEETAQLIEALQTFSTSDIAGLMSLSDKLAQLNYERYQDWQKSDTTQKTALYAFQGDVYQGLEADSFVEEDLDFAQQHLRILSGLYGVLRPFDLIKPYRLEMGTSLSIEGHSNLYDFWGDKITQKINEALDIQKEKTIINLASKEYFKAVKPKNIQGKIIYPNFKEEKGGKFKIVSFFAKKARGMMSAYIIKNRIVQPEQIKYFDQEGYQFNASLSTENEWIFTR